MGLRDRRARMSRRRNLGDWAGPRLGGVPGSGGGPSGLGFTARILIPFYNYPNWYDPPNFHWDEMYAEDGPGSEIIMILNVSNGPGGVGDPNSDYTNAASLDAMLGAGVRMIGYVRTNYAAQPAATVDADVDKWDTDYSDWVTGIFFDEVPNASGDEAYYSARHDHVRSKTNVDSLLILNPGTVPHQNYMAYGDVMVVFDGTEANLGSHTRPAYYSSYSPENFAALVHTATNQASMESDLDTIVSTLGYGYSFVTDDVLADPWDALPSFWSEEAAKMRALNA